MTEPEEKDFTILDEETVQTMDYILRGLELGKFDDTAKKVEFLGKLSGDKSPKYIARLLKRIDELESITRLHSETDDDHTNRIIQLELEKNELKTKLDGMTADMQAVATAIRQLFEPKPLKNNWDMQEIDNFCNKHGANSF